MTSFSVDVYEEFKNKDENQIWSIIKSFLDINYKSWPAIFNDLISEDSANSDSDSTTTEGRIKVRISKTIERSPKLRQQALDFHGYKCQVCDFELTYGKWGKEFAEVHHIKQLSELNGMKYETAPRTYLAVLCANCHRMIHRSSKLKKP